MQRHYVRDWMTLDPVTVSPDLIVSEAYALMSKHHIQCLPVVEGDWFVGMIVLRDLWAAMTSFEADHEFIARTFRMDCCTVLQVMTHRAVTVTPDTPIKVACERMLKHRIGALPVISRGRLVGILTESDIFRLVVDRWSGNEGFSSRQGDNCDGNLISRQAAFLQENISAASR
jgi:acetoin utilization protein AcuB